MPNYTKKLGADNYKKPKKTFQEQLTAEEIEEKMQGYEKVDDIADVGLNTHLRYFTMQDDGTQVFRTGGFLKNKQNADKYVILTNGKNDWCVQVANTVFFSKLTHKDELDAIHKLYKKKLDEKNKIIEKLKAYIKAHKGIEDDEPIGTFRESTGLIREPKKKPPKKPSGSKTAKKTTTAKKPAAKKTSTKKSSTKKTSTTKKSTTTKKKLKK